ncbi:MAG TPA: hemolysin III family protein, partial [Candidatus Hydrogenedentes bacterium]|nr:hemolysin III family protein [Candidatus Hydrogenedentota bacterium]
MKTQNTKTHKEYTVLEEIMNSGTHAVGFGLSVAGLVWLILRAVSLKDSMSLVAVIVFGSSLIALYAASTLYHAVPCFN